MSRPPMSSTEFSKVILSNTPPLTTPIKGTPTKKDVLKMSDSDETNCPKFERMNSNSYTVSRANTTGTSRSAWGRSQSLTRYCDEVVHEGEKDDAANNVKMPKITDFLYHPAYKYQSEVIKAQMLTTYRGDFPLLVVARDSPLQEPDMRLQSVMFEGSERSKTPQTHKETELRTSRDDPLSVARTHSSNVVVPLPFDLEEEPGRGDSTLATRHTELLTPDVLPDVHTSLCPPALSSCLTSLSLWLGEVFPVLLPSDPYLEKWDLAMCLLMIYTATVTPYDIVFINNGGWALMAFNRLVDLGFIIDMGIQFNLAYRPVGRELVKSRKAIASHYLKGWFPVDVISVIPIDLLSQYAYADLEDMQGLRIVRLLRLAKMLRLLRANRLFDKYESRMSINYSMLQLYSFLISLALLCHWMACGWYMVLDIEANEECVNINGLNFENYCCYNWFTCYNVLVPFGDFESSARKYFLALWWSSGELLTVGSDIIAITDAERSYQVVVRVLSGVIYAYLIGAVCSIFTSLTRDKTAFFESMDRLNGFMHEKNVGLHNFDLAVSLRTYYRYSHSMKTSAGKMKEILHNVSPNLKGKLSLQVHQRWLSNIPLFSGATLKESLYVAIAMRLEAIIFSPLECLMDAYSFSDSLHVLDKGVVFVNGCLRHAGETYGEDSLFAWRHGQRRGYSVNALTHGLANVLRTEELLAVLHAPEHHVETRGIRFRLTCCITAQAVRGCYRVFLVAAQMHNFYAGVHTVRTEFEFVEKAGKDLVPLLRVFRRFWVKNNPLDRTVKHAQTVIDVVRRKKELLKKRSVVSAKRNQQTVDTIAAVFTTAGFHNLEFAHKIVEQERLTLSSLFKCSVLQLYNMGLPMGDAQRLVELRSLKEMDEWLAT